MLALFITLGAIALFFVIIFIALIIPFNINFIFVDNKFSLFGKYLFIKFSLIPEVKSKKEKEIKEEKTEEKEEKSTKKGGFIKRFIKRHGIKKIFFWIKDMLKIVFINLFKFIKKIKIKKCHINALIGGSDVSACGETYGKICSIVFGARAYALSLIKIKNESFSIHPDFINLKTTINADVIISLTPLSAIKFALSTGILLLKRYLKFRKEPKI